jgi:hypothetical protein
MANEPALKQTLLRDLPEFLPVPSFHHNSTIVHPEVCDSANQLQPIPAVFSEVNALQIVNMKVKPVSTAMLSGSV